MDTKIGKLVNLVIKAVALAMGVAVVVLSIMDVVDMNMRVMLLGIGLFCLAITAIDKE